MASLALSPSENRIASVGSINNIAGKASANFLLNFKFNFKTQIVFACCIVLIFLLNALADSEDRRISMKSITSIVPLKMNMPLGGGDGGWDSLVGRKYMAMSATGDLIIIPFNFFLLVSNDFGETWRDVTESDIHLPGKLFSYTSMSKDGSKIILASSSTLELNSFSLVKEAHILYSIDSGCTWSETSSMSLFSDVSPSEDDDYFFYNPNHESNPVILASSIDGATAVAAVSSQGTILISTDYGKTFTVSFTGYERILWNCVAVSDNATVILATTGNSDNMIASRSVYLSTDAGSSYTEVSSLLPGNQYTYYGETTTTYVACAMPSTGNKLYLLSDTPSIYLSADFGTSWIDISPAVDFINRYLGELSYGTLYSIESSGDGETVTASIGSDIYLSSNHGISWNLFSTEKQVESMSITSDGSGFVAITSRDCDSEVYRATDGLQVCAEDGLNIFYRSEAFSVSSQVDLSCFDPKATSSTCTPGETLILMENLGDSSVTFTILDFIWSWCPVKKGYYHNAESGGCIKCEYPFTTGDSWGDGHIYCDAIEFVPEEAYYIVVSISSVFIFLVIFVTIIRTDDTEIRKLSLAACTVPAFDFITDVTLLFSTFWNPRWYMDPDVSGTYICTGMNDYSIIIMFVVLLFVIPHIFFIKYLVEKRIESRVHRYFPFQLHQEAHGNYDCFNIFHGIWFFLLCLPMLPWLMYGCLLYQVNLMPICAHWNFWVQGWTGTEEFFDIENEHHLDIDRLKLCQNSHLFTESIPMFALQNINGSNTHYIYSAAEIISITHSGLIITHAIITYFYERCCLGRTHDEMSLEIYFPIPILIEMPVHGCFPKFKYIFHRSYNEPLNDHSKNVAVFTS